MKFDLNSLRSSSADGAAEDGTARKKRKRFKHPVLAAVAVVAVAAVAGSMLLRQRAVAGAAGACCLYTVSRETISNTVTATGTVESQDTQLVYSSLNYPIETIYVEVGDKVEAGQVLCEVDTSDLEQQIESRQLSTQLVQQSSAQQLKTAQDEYNAQASALANGTNTTLLSVQDSVEDAKLSLDNAESDYAEALRTYQRAKDAWNATAAFLPEDATGDTAAEYLAATQEQEQRQAEYDQALSAREQVMLEYEQLMADTAAEDAAIDAAKARLDAADAVLANVSDALQVLGVTLDSTANAALSLLSSGLSRYATTGYDSFSTTLADYQEARAALTQQARSLTAAANSYDRALRDLEVTEVKVQNDLTSAANQLESTRISANSYVTDELELEQLQSTLSEAIVYAPISGTVTACYAEEDSPISTTSGGLGLLFVVEDLDNLIVRVDVDEYDVASLYVGMPVTITSDAAGDAEYTGEVTYIAPTATKTDNGGSPDPGEGEFEVKVAITAEQHNLRVGTGAQVHFIIEQQQDTLSVPYEAIYTNSAGESCVIKIDTTSETPVYAECRVTAGVENDAYVAVSSDELADGDTIVTDPASYISRIGQAAEAATGGAVYTAPTQSSGDSTDTGAQGGFGGMMGGGMGGGPGGGMGGGPGGR